MDVSTPEHVHEVERVVCICANCSLCEADIIMHVLLIGTGQLRGNTYVWSVKQACIKYACWVDGGSDSLHYNNEQTSCTALALRITLADLSVNVSVLNLKTQRQSASWQWMHSIMQINCSDLYIHACTQSISRPHLPYLINLGCQMGISVNNQSISMEKLLLFDSEVKIDSLCFRNVWTCTQSLWGSQSLTCKSTSVFWTLRHNAN